MHWHSKLPFICILPYLYIKASFTSDFQSLTHVVRHPRPEQYQSQENETEEGEQDTKQ